VTIAPDLPTTTDAREPGAARRPGAASEQTPAVADLPDVLRTRPRALLLDFGGVVFQTTKPAEGLDRFTAWVQAELDRGGVAVERDELREVLAGGIRALKDWKNAASRRLAPTELDQRTIVTEFLASPLDAAARELLAGSAGTVLQQMVSTLSDHAVRPGIPELLDAADAAGVRVGIVSNAHSGRAHRALLAEHGLDRRFGVQVYSDEVGLRKPNPAIIELAATALGVTPAESWYVGDTLDRDVVAGRRAGVGGVLLTRHHRTDTPPYPVADRADAVFDTPEGLVELLRATVEAPAGPNPGATAGSSRADAPEPPPAPTATPVAPAAILLDHGGVIVTSTPDPEALEAFAADTAAQLRAAGYDADTALVLRAVQAGRAAQKSWKADGARRGHAEIDPVTFWVDLVGPDLADLGPGVDAWLRSEAHPLMRGYGRAKSRAELRPGVRELLEAAQARGIRTAVVSNTVNGRAVREELAAFGIEHLIGAHVYSDELGTRKPSPAPVRAALTALATDAADAWFVGDKPHRDVEAARAAGIGTSILVRGTAPRGDLGSGAPEPDLVVDGLEELVALLASDRSPGRAAP